MGLFGWVWDKHQDRGIRDAMGAARDADNSASVAQSEIAELRATVDRLALMSQALWEIVRDQTGIQEADLVARIEAIDLRDGVVDGRMREAVSECPLCQRLNRSQRARCLYCGTNLQVSASSTMAPVPPNG